MTRDEVISARKQLTVGLNDSFHFHCMQCGGCCRHQKSILLSPMDIYKMSGYMGITPPEFFSAYCISYVGDQSKLPVVRLATVGPDEQCPLLKNNRCIVHEAKPATCAMYPMGRYMDVHINDPLDKNPSSYKIKYILQPFACNDCSETFTVRDWLIANNVELEDEAYLHWNIAVLKLGRSVRRIEKLLPTKSMETLWKCLGVLLYMNYDHEVDLFSQLKENIQRSYELLDRLAPLMQV